MKALCIFRLNSCNLRASLTAKTGWTEDTYSRLQQEGYRLIKKYAQFVPQYSHTIQRKAPQNLILSFSYLFWVSCRGCERIGNPTLVYFC